MRVENHEKFIKLYAEEGKSLYNSKTGVRSTLVVLPLNPTLIVDYVEIDIEELEITEEEYNNYKEEIVKSSDKEFNSEEAASLIESNLNKVIDKREEKIDKVLKNKQEQIDELGDALLDTQYELLTFKIAMDIV